MINQLPNNQPCAPPGGPQKILLCPGCGLGQRAPELPTGWITECRRCGQLLRFNRAEWLDRALALTITNLILLVIANSFPLLRLQLGERITTCTIWDASAELARQGSWDLATVVFITTMLVPWVKHLGMAWLLLPLRWGRRPPGNRLVWRALVHLNEWGMLEVFLLGVVASMVKLGDVATIITQPALYALTLLVATATATAVLVDPDLLWEKLDHPR